MNSPATSRCQVFHLLPIFQEAAPAYYSLLLWSVSFPAVVTAMQVGSSHVSISSTSNYDNDDKQRLLQGMGCGGRS
jgi:hypothetical protein